MSCCLTVSGSSERKIFHNTILIPSSLSENHIEDLIIWSILYYMDLITFLSYGERVLTGSKGCNISMARLLNMNMVKNILAAASYNTNSRYD